MTTAPGFSNTPIGRTELVEALSSRTVQGDKKRRRSRERKENLIPVRRQALSAAAASAGRVMQIARRPAATRAILTVTAGFSGRRRGGSVRSTKPQPPRPARQGHGRGSGSPKLMIFG